MGFVHQLNPVVQTGPREERIFSAELFPITSAAAMKLLVSCTAREQVFGSPGQRSAFLAWCLRRIHYQNLIQSDTFCCLPRRERLSYSSVPRAEAGCVA